MTWLAEITAPCVVHVTPVDDLIDHEEAVDCVCGPRVRVTARAGGGGIHPVRGTLELVQIITHASLDGRELDEDDHRG